MARERSPNREKARKMYIESAGSMKLIDIAAELNIKDSQVRKWKSQDQWEKELKGALPMTNGNVTNQKGGQPGNRNAAGHGAPKKNNNAEKFGFFRKYLPEETFSIIQEMPTDPLDVLWDQIQIAYAAIIRAQQIMYVRDREDTTTTQVQEKNGDSVTEERWEVQYAWDKQGNFLKAQARAQGELRSLIKQYDELLHKNWELASEEQRIRIEMMKSKAQIDDEEEIADDGFIEALNGTAAEDWSDEED